VEVPVSSDMFFKSMDFAQRVERRARRANIEVSQAQAVRLGQYLTLLERWNAKINLTSLREPDDLVDRLVLEPAAAVRFLPGGLVNLTDIGSGGGSPAIPLKVLIPWSKLRMVEVKTRKAAFLREAVRQLELRDAVVETVRFEELVERPALLESQDVVTVRAVRLEARQLLSLERILAPGGVLAIFASARRSGKEAIPPQLSFEREDILVEALGSRLWTLRKVGR
jgi:16S rRNA (guanine527-N7)-methyltransferase